MLDLNEEQICVPESAVEGGCHQRAHNQWLTLSKHTYWLIMVCWNQMHWAHGNRIWKSRTYKRRVFYQSFAWTRKQFHKNVLIQKYKIHWKSIHVYSGLSSLCTRGSGCPCPTSRTPDFHGLFSFIFFFLPIEGSVMPGSCRQHLTGHLQKAWSIAMTVNILITGNHRHSSSASVLLLALGFSSSTLLLSR